MSWSGDDSDPVGRSGVAGDRAHGSAQRVRQPVAAGSGGAAAGSVGWPPVLLSRPPRRSVEGYLARRPGSVPVHEEAGTGPLFVAERSRRRGDDLAGPARLSFVGDRLALIQTVRERFSCRDCETITQPPAPFHVTPRGFAGPNLLATILFEK